MSWNGWNGLDAGALSLIVFSVVFFVVGLFRVVEFNGLGLRKIQKPLLIAVHVVGCGLFSAAMDLTALSPPGAELSGVFNPRNACLLGALLSLFPIHIYLAIRRRIADSRLSP